MTMVDREEMYPLWDNDVEDWKVDNILKALYGEFGGPWIWKPADWAPIGIYMAKTVKSGKSAKSENVEKSSGLKRLHDSVADDDYEAFSLHKRGRTSGYPSVEPSGDGWKSLEAKIVELFDRFSKQHFAELKLGFERCDEKIQILTTEVVAMGSLLEKLRHPAAEEHVKSNDANLKQDQTGGPVSPVHSPQTSKCDNNHRRKIRRLPTRIKPHCVYQLFR